MIRNLTHCAVTSHSVRTPYSRDFLDEAADFHAWRLSFVSGIAPGLDSAQLPGLAATPVGREKAQQPKMQTQPLLPAQERPDSHAHRRTQRDHPERLRVLVLIEHRPQELQQDEFTKAHDPDAMPVIDAACSRGNE